MTSCGDEAAILQYATSHWAAAKHEELSSSLSQFLPASVPKQSAISNVDLGQKHHAFVVADSNDVCEDNAAALALFRQRLGIYWQQFWQQQQQKSLERHSSSNAQQLSPVASTAAEFVAEQNHIATKDLQQFANDSAKQVSYAPHLWANIAAIAAKNQSIEADLTKLPFSYRKEQQNQGKLISVSPGLGDLLPPPPLLPITTSSLFSSCSLPSSIVSSVSNVSTSTALDRQIAKSPDNPQHKFAEYTSISGNDKSQPLDLTTSSKRSEADSPLSINTNRPHFLSKPAVQNHSETNQEATNHENSATSFGALPSIYNLSFYSQSVPSSSPSLCNIEAPPVAALAPYFQNTSPSVLQSGYAKPDYSAPNGASNQEYLQKWLLRAQQHHQVSAMQQPVKKRRKMSNHPPRPHKQRLSFHPYRLSKDSTGINNDISNHQVTPLDIPRTPGSNGNNRNSGKRYKRYAKPPYSYVSLITLSILSSPEKKLRLSQILKRISEMFPFFNGSYQGWRDSVRHNLSQNECFVKVLKNPFRPTAKGNYWTVNIAAIPHELLLRQNTLVSRYAQESGLNYRKDLSELFNLTNGDVKVKIPEHLFNGDDLVDDPASIMESLLLMDEKDSNPPSPIVHGIDKTHSLIDLFNQDDFVEESLMRQSGGPNRWTGKMRKSRPIPRSSPIQHPSTFAMPNLSQYNNIDSQKLALELVRNSNVAVEPTNAQIIARKKLLAQVMSSSQMSNCLPLLQSYYANSHYTNVLPQTLHSQSPPNGVSFPTNKIVETSDIELQFDYNRHNEGVKYNKMNSDVRRGSSGGDDQKSEMQISSHESTVRDSMTNTAQSSPNAMLCPNSVEANSTSVIERQDSPVCSQASDLSAEILGTSPIGISEELIVSPREHGAPFKAFTSRPVEMSKST